MHSVIADSEAVLRPGQDFVGTDIVISTILGVPLAAFAAWRRGRRRDTVSIAVCTFLESTPPFWIGLLLLIWFGANLKLLPLFGSVSVDKTTGLARVGDILLHLILPATTLVLASVGATFLLARAALLSVIRDDYVLVARPRGCGSAPSPSATPYPSHRCRSPRASSCGSVP